MKAPGLIALGTLLALAAGLSHVQRKTREALKAELIEAVRMGDLPMMGNRMNPREECPHSHPTW